MTPNENNGTCEARGSWARCPETNPLPRKGGEGAAGVAWPGPGCEEAGEGDQHKVGEGLDEVLCPLPIGDRPLLVDVVGLGFGGGRGQEAAEALHL